MSQYVFTKKRARDNVHDLSDITIEFDAITLTEMCEVFTDFLAACAFQVQHFKELSFEEKESAE